MVSDLISAIIFGVGFTLGSAILIATFFAIVTLLTWVFK